MNQTVLITGASRGIGRASAVAFARNGYNVAVNYCKSKEKAAALADELNSYGVMTAAYQADVSDKTEVEEMFRKAEQELGKISALVNNAGIAEQILFSDITEEKWDRMFAVNVKGAYNCTQAVLPSMIHEKKRKNSSHHTEAYKLYRNTVNATFGYLVKMTLNNFGFGFYRTDIT